MVKYKNVVVGIYYMLLNPAKLVCRDILFLINVSDTTYHNVEDRDGGLGKK